MAGMGSYDDRDRNRDRERRDQALRFQPPERVSDEFNREQPRNDFSFQRGQSMETSEKDGVIGETKTDTSQDDSRDIPSDSQSKNQSTDNDTQNIQLNTPLPQELDQPLDDTIDCPPGI